MAATTRRDAPLTGLNTFGIAATARSMTGYSSVADLQALAPLTGPFLHIGQGSNLLFVSSVVETPVLVSAIDGLEITGEDAEGNVDVRIGAANVWDDIVEATLRRGLYGLENLSLVPGTVGAAAVQNIGAYGLEAADRIVTVETVDMATGLGRIFAAGECGYGYRQSVFKRPEMKRYVVTHVTLRLCRRFTPVLTYRGLAEAVGERPTALEVRQAVCAMRRAKLPDPRELGNAGSFFTNPVVTAAKADELAARFPGMPRWDLPDGRAKLSAAYFIDRAGWKGRSLGRAGVYERQPLVLVNLGGATGADIVALAEAVTASVRELTGITLTPEVNYIDG